jgi:hypothetical protein
MPVSVGLVCPVSVGMTVPFGSVGVHMLAEMSHQLPVRHCESNVQPTWVRMCGPRSGVSTALAMEYVPAVMIPVVPAVILTVTVRLPVPPAGIAPVKVQTRVPFGVTGGTQVAPAGGVNETNVVLGGIVKLITPPASALPEPLLYVSV